MPTAAGRHVEMHVAKADWAGPRHSRWPGELRRSYFDRQIE
jgi:hypothetical protein